MRKRRFDSLLETYGANIMRWPRRDIPGAAAFLAASAEARDRLRQVQALDRALADSAPLLDVSTLRRMRVTVAARIARSPLPSPTGAVAGWQQALFQIGCGALVTLVLCVSWLAWAGIDGHTDLLDVPQTLMLAEVRF